MVRKIANLSNERIEITPFGASSFHATKLEELAATFCSCLLLVEPLVFAWLRIFFKLPSTPEAIAFVGNLNFLKINSKYLSGSDRA